MPFPANSAPTFRFRVTRRAWYSLLFGALALMVNACGGATPSAATVADSGRPDGVPPDARAHGDSDPRPPLPTLPKDPTDPKWVRCDLGAPEASVSHPADWMRTNVPEQPCAVLEPPAELGIGSGVRVEASPGDLTSTLDALLDDGWRLLPVAALPPGATVVGPAGQVARIVPLADGSALSIRIPMASPLGLGAATTMVARLAATIRSVAPEPVTPPPPEPSPLMRLTPDPGHVALTFDDGPHPVWTPLILAILDRYQARATFFVVGDAAERHPGLLREIVERGHSVQNHTRDHLRLTELDDDDVREQMAAADRALLAAGVPPSTCLRPPYGVVDERVERLAAEQGLPIVTWNVDTVDWRMPGVPAIIGAGVAARSGDILLFHDGPSDRSQTVEALPWVLEYLSSSGLGFQRLCVDPAAP